MTNLSPPLSILHLAPFPLDTKRRTESICSPSSSTLFIGSSAEQPSSLPPPSAFYANRRQRSTELLQNLAVLAPAAQPQWRQAKSGKSLVEEGTVEAMMVGQQQQPAQKKPGFFRRLSLVSSSPNTPLVQPSNKSQPGEAKEEIIEHMVEQLDTLEPNTRRESGKKKDRGLLKSESNVKDPTDVAEDGPLQRNKVGTTPIDALFPGTAGILSEMDSSVGPYPNFPAATPLGSYPMQPFHSQGPYSAPVQPFSVQGPYPSFPQPHVVQLSRSPSQTQQSYKPFQTSSQNRAPIHAALASNSSPPVSPPGSSTDHGGVRLSRYVSPVEHKSRMVSPSPTGHEPLRGNKVNSLRETRSDGYPQPKPIQPTARTSSRLHGDLRSSLRSKPILSPLPSLPFEMAEASKSAPVPGQLRERDKSQSGKPMITPLLVSNPRHPPPTRPPDHPNSQPDSSQRLGLTRLEGAEPISPPIPTEAPPAYSSSLVHDRCSMKSPTLVLPPGAAPPETGPGMAGQMSVARGQELEEHLLERNWKWQQSRDERHERERKKAQVTSQEQSKEQQQPQPRSMLQSESGPLLPTNGLHQSSNPLTTPPKSFTAHPILTSSSKSSPIASTRHGYMSSEKTETTQQSSSPILTEALSEASKYKMAVAASIRKDSLESNPGSLTSRKGHTTTLSVESIVSSPVGEMKRRPLPHPPGQGTPATLASIGSQRKQMNQSDRKIDGRPANLVPLQAEPRPINDASVPQDSSTHAERMSDSQSVSTKTSTITPEHFTLEQPIFQSLHFEFPHSSTLPPLVDPRKTPGSLSSTSPATQARGNQRHPTQGQEYDPANQRTMAPLTGENLPPRISSARANQRVVQPMEKLHGERQEIIFSPLGGQSDLKVSTLFEDSQNPMQHDQRQCRSGPQPSLGLPKSSSVPILPSLLPSNPLPPATLRGARPRATITFILAYPSIQATLLPYMPINSFLSLMGASDAIRKRFSGEIIGRWVLREWGMSVSKYKSREGQRSWPNLTVWEGFLESLLHDPASFSTYPHQWHPLLQHLCLSHTLIVLHLRSLSQNLFPSPAPLPFEDDLTIATHSFSFSTSQSSLITRERHRSRVNSIVGPDAVCIAGQLGRGKMPKSEKVVEIIMPEPLAAKPKEEPLMDSEFLSQPGSAGSKLRRRGSVGSFVSAATSMSFRKKSMGSSAASISDMPLYPSAAPIPSGKANLPPVSYPSAKRYNFKRHGDPQRSRTSLVESSSRPGSIFSVQSSPSMINNRLWSINSSRASFAVDRNAPPVPGFPASMPMPPPIGGGSGTRGSFSSTSEQGRSGRRSDYDGSSSVDGLSRRDLYTPSPGIKRIEPIFDKPIPFVLDRAPLLRVFVPLSEEVKRWPSSEGCAAAVKELEKCGAMRRLKLGDLVINTAIRSPRTTEHVLIYVPFTRHLLLPLSYNMASHGHLPPAINAFQFAPSYYHSFFPAPQIIYLDLTPFGQEALESLRLAYDRRDMTVASGARVSAKRYLHVAGFQIHAGQASTDPAWEGFVSLESEGTVEGKQEIERRLMGDAEGRGVLGPWEIVRDKCMVGNVWLKLVREE
ncbi:uncharacterized protein L203_104324 [Cryptococcus depauperatus CBS 7841]|uniref:Uncharacterized protein n=1 Tax=Cryptococcus depauperatus CBS 7841 TaxID=1295531 RepID=A0A1E3IFV4_9TREE|nr:hypothetical protein L203_03257 [Cryptococcus depauperatus CBS 7841]